MKFDCRMNAVKRRYIYKIKFFQDNLDDLEKEKIFFEKTHMVLGIKHNISNNLFDISKFNDLKDLFENKFINYENFCNMKNINRENKLCNSNSFVTNLEDLEMKIIKHKVDVYLEKN